MIALNGTRLITIFRLAYREHRKKHPYSEELDLWMIAGDNPVEVTVMRATEDEITVSFKRPKEERPNHMAGDHG